mmetsp:Transcript_126147/g.315305  ORF Transcript_126147/g.315305 Transcript_126147/m.315305 type:complete len:206 (+) Transcript_126147:171-788(+)
MFPMLALVTPVLLRSSRERPVFNVLASLSSVALRLSASFVFSSWYLESSSRVCCKSVVRLRCTASACRSPSSACHSTWIRLSFSSATVNLVVNATSFSCVCFNCCANPSRSCSADASFSSSIRCFPSSNARLASTSDLLSSSISSTSCNEAFALWTLQMLACNSSLSFCMVVTCCASKPFSPCNASKSSCNCLLSLSAAANLSLR